jgi:ubiquitin thioesterase protein OTUB1
MMTLTLHALAVAFGYFEVLIRQNKVKTFQDEEARMLFLRSLVQDAGTSPDVCEEFFEEAIDLLKKLADSLPLGTAETYLLNTFNDEGIQAYIVFCMKVSSFAASLITCMVTDICPAIGCILDLDSRSRLCSVHGGWAIRSSLLRLCQD